MAYSQDDLAHVEEAIAAGILEVEMENRRIRFNTLDELKSTRQLILDDLGRQGLTERPRFKGFRFRHSSGIE